MTVKRLFVGLAIIAIVTVKVVLFFGHYDTGPTIKLPVNDPGAGPLPMNLSDCYIAIHRHQGEPCAEPKLAAPDASIAVRVAAYLDRAVFDIDMQEPEQALQETDAALALDGDNAEARHLAGRIYLTLFDLNRAEREVTTARRLKSHDPRIETTYAVVLIGRRANREAVGVLDDVIRRYPGYQFARNQRATLFTYLGECCARGNYQVALTDYEFLIRNNAPDPSLLGKRAGILLSLGQTESAVADLSDAIKLSPSNVDLLITRADAYVALNNDELAVKDYNAVLADAAPGVPLYVLPGERRAKLLVARAYSLVRLRHLEDAVRDADAAISVGGKSAILRAQILLRRHGFPDVPVDGENSDKLKQALSACFGLKACYQPVLRAI